MAHLLMPSRRDVETAGGVCSPVYNMSKTVGVPLLVWESSFSEVLL
ncbi:hypothetical protein RMSM_05215 [Rhodopirellula maiorica SM1]|uniref:Uncharacterized protein n=1 Tax=Rhodopirellula maiorica SM1 TaxID=1265738 RepID=M5RR55_9BACT|nr:hypothetical protein RMSM_05215 [Rhodopirellula maiorica SM1]